MTFLAQYVTLRHGAKGRGYRTAHHRPIISGARAQLALVSVARSAVRGPVAEGYCA